MATITVYLHEKLIFLAVAIKVNICFCTYSLNDFRQSAVSVYQKNNVSISAF